ncbi:VWA domain-containing protein [Microbulbifer elongatus]|uniref:VWA domain-containing protein n=1 Tax=Microbulbifer elongatus TaxID=86173 RepID=A0ABT1P3E2_9GAMM|nr:VWA domain-containing protein [Microbulbifer elongatus]
MSFFADLHQFHFLRPAILLLILPAALLCWALARTVFASGRLQKIIDPDLLPHLLLKGGEKRPWLFTLIFTLLTCAIVALAGPTWRKLPTPVYSNQDAVVILLDLSPSMMATDLSPNRLTRARLKILDILKQRKDGLTALIAYAGEAHVVTPLTDDTATIANLVPSLSPRIMPVPGSNIEMAVQAGLRLLKDGAGGQGRLLAVTDGIAKSALGTVKSEMNSSNATLSILAVGSGEGSPIPKNTGSGFITDDSGSIIIANFDRGELQRLANSTGGQFAQITVDDRDINRVLPDDTSPQQAELTEREFDQWNEEGPWLVLLLLPFALLLFRKGTLACLLPLSLPLIALLATPEASAQESGSLWQTPNQQAEKLLQQGNPDAAAKVFENSQWRGTAQYRAGEYDAAAKSFAESIDPQGLYNLGNSLTQQGQFDQAIEAFDRALQQNPEFADARHNKQIAEELKKLQQQQQQNQQSQQSDQQQNQDDKQDQQQGQQSQNQSQQNQQQGDSDQLSQEQQSQNQQQSAEEEQQQNADQGEQDQSEQEQQQQADSQHQNQDGEASEQPTNGQPQESQSELDPETQQALDQWLRQIPDDPAGLMREKFKYESLQRRRAYRAGEWQPPENGATQRW